ncbi:MAG: hypothetical protein IJM79_07670 [Erysipelotrichaceae bacterium]|nr:hypothetical protein [Erysipelotrichaceae bacterium]
MKRSTAKYPDAIGYLIMIFLIFQLSGYPLWALEGMLDLHDKARFVIWYVTLIISMAAGAVLQTAVHEAGHLVMGLLTGYRFVSYRIFSLMILKDEDGRLKLKRLSVPGTLGQCLMAPPDYSDRFPFFLYNAGGVMFNLLTALLFIASAFLVPFSWLKVLFSGVALSGILMACTNGVPIKGAMAPNDGMNILEMLVNRSSRYAFWVQMKVNEMLREGMRVGEIESEMLAGDSDTYRAGALGASLVVYQENRFMDRHEYQEADAVIEEGIQANYPFAGFHRDYLLMDKITINCINKRFSGTVDDRLAKLINNTKAPYALRCQYAIAMYEKDFDRAKAIVSEMEKMKETYPFPRDFQSDLEIMDDLTRALSGELPE